MLPKRPSIEHYAFYTSVVVLVYMIERFLLFSNAHSMQCILAKTGSLNIYLIVSDFLCAVPKARFYNTFY